MKVLDIDGLNYYDGKIKQTYATKTELNAKAPLASPTLTGTPTAPTPTAGDNSTKLATTAYVQGALSGATPTSIADTEIQQYWTGVTPEQVNQFLSLSGGTMTGNITLADGGNPLSTAGGTMSGSIELSGDWTHIGSTANTPMIFQHNKLTQGLELWGGNSSVTGASLILRGASNDDGKFYLGASQKTSDSDSSHSRVLLEGNPNGSLTWNSKEIERVNASGSNYIRFESGVQICWGHTENKTATAGSTSQVVTFPVAFKNSDYAVSVTSRYVSGSWTNNTTLINGNTTTSVELFLQNITSTAYTFYFVWIAVGYWK